MRLRTVIWVSIAALVVVATRAVVYALVPTQGALLEELARSEGGPHLAGVLSATVVIGVLVSIAVLWLAVVAVRERLALEDRALVAAPRLRPRRLAGRAAALFVVASLAFALLESYIHWRAGLGWHGLSCLLGPVHRDALPILVALTVVAVAGHGAVEHLLTWARRLVARLAARLPLLRNPEASLSPISRACTRVGGSAALPRGPPGRAVPVLTL
jgi:hypothetical protein